MIAKWISVKDELPAREYQRHENGSFTTEVTRECLVTDGFGVWTDYFEFEDNLGFHSSITHYIEIRNIEFPSKK